MWARTNSWEADKSETTLIRCSSPLRECESAIQRAHFSNRIDIVAII